MKKLFLMFLLSTSLFGARINSLCDTECGLYLLEEEIAYYESLINSDSNQDLKVMCRDQEDYSFISQPEISIRTTLGRSNEVVFKDDINICDIGKMLNGSYEYVFDTVKSLEKDAYVCANEKDVKVLVRYYELDENKQRKEDSVKSRVYCVKPIEFIVTSNNRAEVIHDLFGAGDNAPATEDEFLYLFKSNMGELNDDTLIYENHKKNIKASKFFIGNKICYIYDSRKIMN